MEMDMETETDMEMETETDNTLTWTWTRTRSRTWNFGIFGKYFIRCNCPYGAIWNALGISQRNFQLHYRLIAPLHHENDDMQILKIHSAVGIVFQMMC
jgi:hypothetical protein